MESSGDGEMWSSVDAVSRQLVDDHRQIVVVDCRPTEAFRTAHVFGAENLSLPTLMARRLVRGQLAASAVIGIISQHQQPPPQLDDWKILRIIFYDDSTSADAATSSSTSTCLVMLLGQRFRDDGYRATILDGGFDKFRRLFPNLCSSSTSNADVDNDTADDVDCPDAGDAHVSPLCEKASRLSLKDDDAGATSSPSLEVLMSAAASPTLVVPYLYIGNAQNALDMDCLTSNDIRYIVNVTNNVPNRFEDDERFHYLQIPVKDHWSQSLTAYLPSAITFIDEARRVHRGVLVHCLAGISRSVTVAVAYLMASMCLSLDDAYERVKRCRPHASPSLNFMGQLLDFQTTLRSRRKQVDGDSTTDGTVDGGCSARAPASPAAT